MHTLANCLLWNWCVIMSWSECVIPVYNDWWLKGVIDEWQSDEIMWDMLSKLYVWERINKAKADAFAPAVASGLICGDGIWTLPASILALAGVKPPICMKFLSRAANARVDTLLGN